MTYLKAFFACGLVAAASARAVYAPIPEQEQGKDLTFTFSVGLSHDSNIFGSAAGAIDSMIYEFSPKVVYNASVTEKSFVSLSYQAILDQFDNRPGDKLLDSHMASARFAHAFSPKTTLDIVDLYQASRNPESLLNGLPINADQSSQRNELDGHYTTSLSPKVGLDLKARTVYYNYRNPILARSLNRIENLFGAAADYALLPELKAVGEYRHQDVYYDKEGETKNKNSDFLMFGADYAVAKKLTTSGRVGAEWRHRSRERSTTAPYVEFSGKYDYADASFITGGYTYTLEESSDTARFTDTKVDRVFVNVQHTISPLLIASGSLTYEASVLQGRRTFANVNDHTIRGGVALSYLPNKHWTISFSYDDDHVTSDEAARKLDRERFALNAAYTF
jgi:hypothetical protein